VGVCLVCLGSGRWGAERGVQPARLSGGGGVRGGDGAKWGEERDVVLPWWEVCVTEVGVLGVWSCGGRPREGGSQW